MPERRRAPARRGPAPVKRGGPASRGAPAGRARPGARAAATRAAVPIAGPVRILFLDVDGTLTDGTITFDGAGDGRSFWIRDGLALKWAQDLGVLPVVISGRGSLAVEGRMRDLGLEFYLGVADKVAVAERVLARERAGWESCAMAGDDLPDVALMRRVAWPIAVGDADPEVKRVAKTVTRAGGGRGAVREIVTSILQHNGTWQQVLDRYQVPAAPRSRPRSR